MYSFLLQDWITLSGNPTVTNITQSELDWMSFQPYQDIVLYTECKSLQLAGANNIQIIYETSPTKDESLFSAMATVSLEVNQVQVSPIILATAPAIPLARWVRWRLHVDGVADSNWLTTFRLHCAANAVGVI